MRSSGPAVRGALSGAVAGAGAWMAHALSGGEVHPLAGAVALVASAVLGSRLAAGGGPLRITALALGVQSLWHLVFVSTAPAATTGHGAHAAHGAHAGATDHASALTMLGAHALVAALTVAVAVGLDRVLVSATVRMAAALMPPLLVRRWRGLPPWRPAPVRSEPVSPRETSPFLVVRVLRGPPAPHPSAVFG